jgi:chromosome segregation protein
VYLRRIALRGFKTFVAPTDLEFDGGVTAIVGPNGSGKSNLVDALRWVLGEQSLRLLRGRRTEDVIFAGSSQRARVGLAEVNLVLDNESGWLQLPYSEVTITRRAHRSGETEYQINGSRVRLRDLHDILIQGNAHHTAYTIISQGMVDSVLAWKAEERRLLIEEAAQLRQPQARLEEARQKLHAVHNDLVKSNNSLSSILPRLERTSRLAADAQEHQRLTSELLVLNRRFLGVQWAAANAALASADEQLQRAVGKLKDTQEKLSGVRSDIELLMATRRELGPHIEEVSNRRTDLQRSIEVWRRSLAVAKERSVLLADNRQQAIKQIATLSERATHILPQVSQTEQQLQSVIGEKSAVLEEIERATKNVSSVRDAQTQVNRELSNARKRLSEASLLVDQIHQDQLRVEYRRRELNRAFRIHQNAIEQVEARLRQRQLQLQQSVTHRARLEAEISDRKRDLEQEETHLASAQRTLSTLNSEREDLRLECERQRMLRRQVDERGESLLASLRGSTASGGNLQLFGTVEQILSKCGIEVPSGMEQAVNAALRPFLTTVVAGTWDDIELALAVANGQSINSLRIIPDGVSGTLPLALSDSGCHGLASSLVSCNGSHARFLAALLSRSIIVDDWATANRLAPQLSPEYQLVTLKGEIIHPWGWVEVFTASNQQIPSEDGYRNLEIDSARLSQLEAAIATAATGISDRQRRGRKAQAVLHETQTAFRLAEAEVSNVKNSVARLESELSNHNSLLEQNRRDCDLLNREDQELAQRLPLARVTCDTLQTEVKALTEKQASLASQRNAALANLEHRREMLKREEQLQYTLLKGLNQRLSEIHHELNERQVQADSFAKEEHKATNQIEEATSKIDELSGQIESLANIEAFAQVEAKRINEKIESLRRDENDYHQRSVEQETARQSAATQHEQTLKQVSTLERQIMDQLGSMDALEIGTIDDNIEIQLHQVEDAIRRIGTIEPNVIGEYQELQSEYDRMTAHRDDIERSLLAMGKLVARLEGALNERFNVTFRTIRTEYERYFRALFGGGRGTLQLVSIDEGSPPGLEIIAQPPGKRPQSLASLSGGEKALASIAMLFSLLSVQPPPFCVLDEVDAALDDANASRFSEILGQLAKRTQFLVITHNRVTMEAAGMLYGVTMSEAGASQIVSMRVPREPNEQQRFAGGGG